MYTRYGQFSMRLRLILLGIAIPLILTATIFAGPSVRSNMASLDSLFSATSNAAQAASGNVHDISMTAVELPSGLLAYQMLSHKVTDSDNVTTTNITSNYSDQPSIPGPVIVFTEGDTVHLTIYNDINSRPDQQVSVHVHGVHYDIDSDGTLQAINMIADQGALPHPSGAPHDLREEPYKYTYTWVAAPGTAGSWPYHDHNFGTINGAEHRGLVGAIIVNPASGTVVGTDNRTIVNDVPLADVKKDFVLYVGDDAFWGMEIDTADGKQTPLWVNPTLKATPGDYVRFHLIPVGTDLHKFRMAGYFWVDPGTADLISSKDLGPLENHQFTVKTRSGNAPYMDMNESNLLMGMKGSFVGASGSSSIPGPLP